MASLQSSAGIPDVEKQHRSSSGSENDDKKEDVVVYDSFVDASGTGSEALKLVGIERQVEFSDEYNARLKKKLDRWIPPLCAAVYFTQFLDKTSLNYASVMEFPLEGQQYNLLSMAFYIGFLSWEFPTVYISQKLRLGKYLGANIVAWGAVLMLHAVPSSFGSLFALRVLLGMFESCVAPSLILIIGMFYKKDEQGSRIAFFYLMNGLTEILGGFLAFGVSYYDGGRIIPYKIIFLLLGGLAIVVGVCVLIWMPDSPVHAQLLTMEEKIAVLERVRNDQGGSENKKIKLDQVKETLLDVRTWLIVASTLITNIPNGGLGNFRAKIVKAFGFTSRQTLIVNTPGGAVAAATTFFCGWLSDKKGERMLPMLFTLVPTFVGAAIMIGLNGTGNRAGLLIGSYMTYTVPSSLSLIYAYNASNISGHTKKVTINALTMFSFCVGNIAGAEIFLPKDAPDYIPGKVADMILIAVQIVVCFVLRATNVRMNKKKRAALAEMKEENGWSDQEKQNERERHAFMDLTDKK